MSDMMPLDQITAGLPASVWVRGWDAMVNKSPTRAAILQALANLQLRASVGSGTLPTQLEILREVISHGLIVLVDDREERIEIKISPTSQKEVNRHINNHLIPDGYIVTRDDYEPNEKRGRGGPSAPWMVVAISHLLRNRLSNPVPS